MAKKYVNFVWYSEEGKFLFLGEEEERNYKMLIYEYETGNFLLANGKGSDAEDAKVRFELKHEGIAIVIDVYEGQPVDTFKGLQYFN